MIDLSKIYLFKFKKFKTASLVVLVLCLIIIRLPNLSAQETDKLELSQCESIADDHTHLELSVKSLLNQLQSFNQLIQCIDKTTILSNQADHLSQLIISSITTITSDIKALSNKISRFNFPQQHDKAIDRQLSKILSNITDAFNNLQPFHYLNHDFQTTISSTKNNSDLYDLTVPLSIAKISYYSLLKSMELFTTKHLLTDYNNRDKIPTVFSKNHADSIISSLQSTNNIVSYLLDFFLETNNSSIDFKIFNRFDISLLTPKKNLSKSVLEKINQIDPQQPLDLNPLPEKIQLSYDRWYQYNLSISRLAVDFSFLSNPIVFTISKRVINANNNINKINSLNILSALIADLTNICPDFCLSSVYVSIQNKLLNYIKLSDNDHHSQQLLDQMITYTLTFYHFYDIFGNYLVSLHI